MNKKGEIHVGDVGTKFTLQFRDGDAILNIAPASLKQVIFKKPDGTTVVKSLSFTADGFDGSAFYVTVASDLDQAGSWELQGYLEMPSGKWHSNSQAFVVHANLA